MTEKMKSILKYLSAGICAIAAVSCIDTLDTHPVSSFDEETVWGSRATAEAFINATTGSVLSSAGYGSGASVGWQVRTPDGIQFSQVSEGTDGFALENGRPEVNPFSFSLLRRCNLIIEKVEASENMDETSKRELAGTGHLLRGMIFFNAARQCGRLVPITEVLSESDSLKANVPMTKDAAESYRLVIEDLQIAARDMAETSLPGVPNKYAAEVLLSRAALQAYAYTNDASYLDVAIEAAKDVVDHNGLTSNYRNLFNQQGATDPEILWGYYRLPNNTTMGEFSELMRTYPNVSLDNMKNSQSPVTYKAASQTFECWAIYFPTQDMVDQYLVRDEATGEALPWWETSQYKDNVEELDVNGVTEAGCVDSYKQLNGSDRRIPSPEDLSNAREDYAHFTHWARLKDGVTDRDISDIIYGNRDNRFDGTIIHDKSTWLGETIETMLSGNFSQGVRDKEDGGWYNTSTGYYWLKGIAEPEERAYFENSLEAHYVVARVGEAYMNLAEAYLCKGDVANAVNALNVTREQHGGLAPSTASTVAQAWEDYIRERRVEMANECADIYYSYLRWGKYGGDANHGKHAGDVIEDLNRPVYKIQISRDRKQLLIGQHTINQTAKRTFTVRRYLLPISQSFLDTREAYGLDHEQVQGW